MPDRIYVRDLAVRCIIGINDWERQVRQDVVVNLALNVDLRRPGQTDDIGDTVDYKVLKDSIVEMVEASRFLLIERLAEEIARLCFTDSRISAATVTVDKPGALSMARSVAVEIHRERSA
jgi:FolB domain-containing protein